MEFTEILDRYGIEYKIERPGWVNFRCPYCGSFPYMGYNQRGYTNCWRCGPKWLGGVLREISGRKDSIGKELLDSLNIDWSRGHEGKTGQLRYPSGAGWFLPAHTNYLYRRLFNPEELTQLWWAKGTSHNSDYPWRIVLPIIYHGREVSWTARTIGEGEPRYVFPTPERETLHAKDLLFGEDYCRHAIVVCEGPFDAIRIGPGAVATMGTSVTQAQLLKISKYPVRVILFDSEPQAQERAKKLVEILEPYPGSTFRIDLEKSKDPASASPSEIARIRKSFLEV